LARGRARPWRVAVARQAPLPTARPRLARRSRARLCPTRSPRPIPCSVRLPALARSPACSRGLRLGAAWPWCDHGAHSRRSLGGARAAPAPGTASVVRAEPRRGPCSAWCPRRARRTRGSRLWRSARRPQLARPCAARPRPGAASASAAMVPLRSAACAQLGPGVCATRSRLVSAALRVRARMVHGALAWLAVPSTRRVAPRHVLDALVYP
jgi:hypothetical protein